MGIILIMKPVMRQKIVRILIIFDENLSILAKLLFALFFLLTFCFFVKALRLLVLFLTLCFLLRLFPAIEIIPFFLFFLFNVLIIYSPDFSYQNY